MPDFLQSCMADLQTNDKEAFQQTFCQRCKNPECERAGWARDKFGERVSTQADRLLNPKIQITQAAGSRYEHLKDFMDMAKQAIQLEIADHRGDWTVPGESSRAFVPDFRGAPATSNPATPAPAPASPPNPVAIPEHKNTPPPPPEGIMVGGGMPPASPRPAANPKVVDDWDPKPVVLKITPGAKIKLGGD